MEIFRTENPEVLRWMLPHLVESEDYTKEVIVEEILTALAYSPENICIIMAIDGPELIGYAVSSVVRNHAWMGQAWTDENYNREIVGKEILEQTKIWAKDKGLVDIRFETDRSTEALTRAWGFEEFSSIMRMEI
jgi:hypothetical protein